MCPKPFSWAKKKRKLFFYGKSRGPLLAGAALKTLSIQKEDVVILHKLTCTFVSRDLLLCDQTLWSLGEQPSKLLSCVYARCPYVHRNSVKFDLLHYFSL